jgi:predicted lipoprotein with Yx(FWY)xxD motif
MRLIAAAAAALALLALAAPAQTASMRPAKPAGVLVSSSPFGQILFDHRIRALYIFTKDGKGPSRCYGACAAAWPPYLVKSKPRALTGAKASLIGTVKRTDGTLQVTYAGRPVYFYRGDTQPHQVLCQNVFEYGGLWLVVRGSGTPVR